jgi:hypothetical protein
MLALQNLRLHRLDSSYSASQQAQIYYNNLTPLVRRHMALRDPKRKDPEIRDDLDEVRQETRDVGASSNVRRTFSFFASQTLHNINFLKKKIRRSKRQRNFSLFYFAS